MQRGEDDVRTHHFLFFACAAARIFWITFSTSGCGSGDGGGKPSASERSYGPMNTPSAIAQEHRRKTYVLVRLARHTPSAQTDGRTGERQRGALTEAVDGEDVVEVVDAAARLDLDEHEHGVVGGGEVLGGGEARAPRVLRERAAEPAPTQRREARRGDERRRLRARRDLTASQSESDSTQPSANSFAFSKKKTTPSWKENETTRHETRQKREAKKKEEGGDGGRTVVSRP